MQLESSGKNNYRPGASSEEGRETEGAKVHGSTNNIIYKKTVRETWWIGPPGWSDWPRLLEEVFNLQYSIHILEFRLD